MVSNDDGEPCFLVFVSYLRRLRRMASRSSRTPWTCQLPLPYYGRAVTYFLIYVFISELHIRIVESRSPRRILDST
jgi:hypothetical protein